VCENISKQDITLCHHSTDVVYDNNFVYGWSRNRENDDNTRDTMIFRQVPTSRRIIVLRHVFLYCLW
jgi:hypothetical protein